MRLSGRLDDVEVLHLTTPPLGLRQVMVHIEGLSKLHTLSLAKTDWLPDLSPLTTLPALRRLALNHAEGVDLEALVRLTDLEHLLIARHSPGMLHHIQRFPRLRSLVLSINHPEDLDVLSRLVQLEHLTCIGHLPTLDWLEALPNLQRLSLDRYGRDPMVDLAPIRSLTSLTSFSLTDKSRQIATDLTPFADMPRLESLQVPAHPGLDFTPLHGLPALRRLVLTNTSTSHTWRFQDCRLFDTIGLLAGLLEGVWVDQTGAPVRGGRKLSGLSLMMLLHVTPPPGQPHPLASAQSLNLRSTCGISQDLTPHATMDQLKSVALSGSRGRRTDDHTPLALLPGLERVVGSEKAEGREAVLRLQKRLARTFIRSTQLIPTPRDEAWLERMRLLGLLGAQRHTAPAEISRLLASNRQEPVIEVFEGRSRLSDPVIVQKIADGIQIDRGGQLILTHTATKRPHLRRKESRAMAALMSLRVAGRLEDLERLALGPHPADPNAGAELGGPAEVHPA